MFFCVHQRAFAYMIRTRTWAYTQFFKPWQRSGPDLQDLVQFVEEGTILINDPLFSREALHEYTKAQQKKPKDCFVKVDEKKDVCDNSGLKLSLKCQCFDGNHDLDDCQFYNELSVEDRSSFLKKRNLCYGCYSMIKSAHTARTYKNKRVCKVCQRKHLSRLHSFKMKCKKPSDDDKHKIDKQPGAMKNNCAGIKNAVTVVGEVISMCCTSEIKTLQLTEGSGNICLSRLMWSRDICDRTDTQRTWCNWCWDFNQH